MAAERPRSPRRQKGYDEAVRRYGERILEPDADAVLDAEDRARQAAASETRRLAVRLDRRT